MRDLLFLYIGLTYGLCLMDYLNLKYNFHIYRDSIFNIFICILFAPILVPLKIFKYFR